MWETVKDKELMTIFTYEIIFKTNKQKKSLPLAFINFCYHLRICFKLYVIFFVGVTLHLPKL